MTPRPGYPGFIAIPLPNSSHPGSHTVEEGFWRKLLKFAGRIPFAEELAAAYFCATDPATPAKVRAVLIGALAYFVLPADAIPDFVAGLGFTDDAAVLAAAIGLVSAHIHDRHYGRARLALGIGGAQTTS